MVWKHLVLKILQKIGLKGHLPKFIANFLKNRKIKVKIGDILSPSYNLENGLPQGSVLSCLVFLLIINTIFDETEDEISKSLFCDDGVFWASGGDLEEVTNTIQRALDTIAEWCDYHGPKISQAKTHFNVFTRKKENFETPTLKLNGINLKREKTVTYLGVKFDQGLYWKHHIDHIVEKCQQPLNVMRKVARHDWGGDRTSLKMMYTALVRSKMDYACFLFSHAAKCHLDKLNKIQYEAVRIITGNYKCTVIDNLEAEVHLLPLALRRRQLALHYFGKAYRIKDHPGKTLYENFHRHPFYDLRPHALPIAGRTKGLIVEKDIPIQKLEQLQMQDNFIENNSKISYSLVKNKKSYTEIEFQTDFHCLIENKYNNYTQIFTDGSKTEGKCGSAFIVKAEPSVIVKKRLPTTCSILTAELYAILLALRHIHLTESDNFVIFSDSLSSLQFLENNKLDHRIKVTILKLLNTTNKNIHFEWVPGHANINGNEQADCAAKEALTNNRIVKLPMSYDEYKIIIKTYVYDQWQNEWTEKGRCRLKKFKPILGDWKSAYRKNRREEKVLSRLRTGSCLFLNQHYFDPTLPVENCNTCNVVLTINHILVECPTLNNNRYRIANYLNQKKKVLSEENILNDIFPHDLLFKFLKETPYYKKI